MTNGGIVLFRWVYGTVRAGEILGWGRNASGRRGRYRGLDDTAEDAYDTALAI